MVFIRKSFDKESYDTLIREFMSHLDLIHSQMADTVPRQVMNSIIKIEGDLLAFKNGERTYSPQQVTEMRRGLSYLKKMTNLHVYGYNSSGFDIPVLFQGEYI